MAAVHPPQHETAALDDSGSLYRLIADTIPHLVWTARADGITDYHNRRVEEYTGLDAAQLEGWGWKAMVHAEDWEVCLERWTRALQTGERYQLEYRLRRADGVYRWHHASAMPLRDAAGRIVRWFGTATDIDDQVRSAQVLERKVEERTRELRATQKRLRALIENEPECVKLIDAQGMLLEMNAAGLRMIEADSAARVIGHCVYPIVSPEHRDAFRELTERVCRGERGSLEFEVVGLRGARRWLETHAVPFREEASAETRLLGITRDVTDRRQADEALQALLEGTASVTGEPFFTALVRSVARAVRVRTAFVTELLSGERVRILAMWSGDQLAPPSEYGLAGTPCELVFQNGQAFYPDAVQERFPQDRDLTALGAMSYLGMAMAGTDGRTIGHLCILDDKPLVNQQRTAALLRIFLSRAAAELERARTERALLESEQRFRSFMDNAPAVAWIKNSRFCYTYVNRSHEQLFGRPASELLGREDSELYAPELARFFRDDDEKILRAGAPTQKVHELPGKMGHWLVVKFPLRDAAGGMGVAGIAIDATPRLEAEEKARRSAEDVRQLMDRLVGAQEAERHRVAGDLHDLIGQNLTALGIDLQALKQQLHGGGDAGTRLDAMAALVETTIDAIRGVMTDLRPAALEEFGLVPALRWYAALFAQRTGMKLTTQLTRREFRLPPDTELAVFRVVQEALTNAAKHSGGSAVSLRLVHQDGALRVTVEDDGRGFPDPVGARGARRGGFGLPTMRERIEARGGTLRVEQPGRGTRLVIEVPAGGDAD